MRRSSKGCVGIRGAWHPAAPCRPLGTGALLTDPHSPANLLDTLERALTLTPAERRTRLDHLAELLGHQHPTDWAAEIITAIRSDDNDNPPPQSTGHDQPSRTTRNTGSGGRACHAVSSSTTLSVIFEINSRDTRASAASSATSHARSTT